MTKEEFLKTVDRSCTSPAFSLFGEMSIEFVEGWEKSQDFVRYTNNKRNSSWNWDSILDALEKTVQDQIDSFSSISNSDFVSGSLSFASHIGVLVETQRIALKKENTQNNNRGR